MQSRAKNPRSVTTANTHSKTETKTKGNEKRWTETGQSRVSQRPAAVLVQMFVHVVQLGREVALDLRPPALERGRQQAVLHRERVRVEVNVFDLFE